MPNNHRGAPRTRQTARRSRGFVPPSRTNPASSRTPDSEFTVRSGVATLVIADDDDDDNDDVSNGEDPSITWLPPARNPANTERTVYNTAQSRLPPLTQPAGPPIRLQASVGGSMMAPVGDDPRITAVSRGFPVSVHPLRLPNSRAQFAAGISIVDFRFVRLAGLLHRMIPLREGVDDVSIGSLYGGGEMRVYGRVKITFDAQGYEFVHQFWVTNIGLPFEMQLGDDFSAEHGISMSFKEGGTVIEDADAKKARKLVDLYVIE